MFFDNDGALVPTTSVWDPGEIGQIDVNSPAFKELLVRMYQNLNLMANVLNIKRTGYFPLGEMVNGQLFFPNPAYDSTTANAPEYRTDFTYTMNFGALPNTGVKAVAHGLTPNTAWIATHIYATASDTTGLTYANLESLGATMVIDATNVTITTTSNVSNYDQCIVVWEYIKF